MSVGAIRAVLRESLIDIAFDVFGTPFAISVQAALDADFTKALHHFVSPVAPRVTLALGGGAWFFRVGCWNGRKEFGKITWSATYGPAVIGLPIPIVKPEPPIFRVLHVKNIADGVRFFTDNTQKLYAVIESSRDSKFPASQTTTHYSCDFSRGFWDCLGLDPTQSHSVRMASWAGAHELPTHGLCKVTAFLATHGRHALRSVAPKESGTRVTNLAENTILREVEERGTMRFTSHEDYIRYRKAREKAENGEIPFEVRGGVR